MNALDPRLHAVRPDLADIALQGRVDAPRFAPGAAFFVSVPRAPVRSAPSADAPLLTEALAGEAVSVFETTADGWCWSQLEEDRYVGWVPADALAGAAARATHKVSALSTFIFPRPDIKAPPLATLPFGATVAVRGEAEDKNACYALIEPAGAVPIQHLAPLDNFEQDWTDVAERFLGAPYLWGGKTSAGLDCSGLVQVALRACGIPAPRDTDMQEAALGAELPADSIPGRLRRGDLVFWKGHVGIMRDAETLLHANAHHMAVAVEPLAAAMERFSRRGLDVSSVRRVG